MKTLLTILLFISTATCFSQTMEDFKKDYKNALAKDFSEEQLNEMFKTYTNILTPHSDITQMMAGLKGEAVKRYPLREFKTEKLYKNSINDLMDSGNAYHRILAYLVIASAGDMSFEAELLKRIKEEKPKGNLIWSGMALLHIQTEHTTPLFDFLVNNETFGDAHMLPLYFQLNPDSLQATAYQRIHSENITAKILAVQLLSVTPKNERTEKLVLDAVKNWDLQYKGYAIYTVKVLEMENLLPTFQPLLDSSKTRRIAIEALANSPTKADNDYLKGLIEAQDTVSDDLLDGFFNSTNPENMKYWLKILRTKPVPQDYYISLFKQPLIYSDEVLTDLQLTLEECTNNYVIQNLVKGLENRADQRSINICIDLLRTHGPTVRYWTADTFKNTKSPLIINEIIKLIKSPLYREVSFTDLLINNNIDTLQGTFEAIYSNTLERDWKRSSIEYLSTFPLEKHKDIFKAILTDNEEDTFIKRNAALGLGRLKDESAVDLIIEVCKEESSGSDYNAAIFLRALSMIKGKKAKAYISSFKDSKAENIRALVTELLADW